MGEIIQFPVKKKEGPKLTPSTTSVRLIAQLIAAIRKKDTYGIAIAKQEMVKNGMNPDNYLGGRTKFKKLKDPAEEYAAREPSDG